MLQLTSAAAQEVLDAAARSDAAGMALRVAARRQDDGSIEYGIGFDEERADDAATAFGDLTVLVGAPSAPLLVDTVLDFVEVEPGCFGFVFIPPEALAGPGCGSGPGSAPGAARGGCGNGGCGGCR